MKKENFSPPKQTKPVDIPNPPRKNVGTDGGGEGGTSGSWGGGATEGSEKTGGGNLPRTGEKRR